MTEVKGFQCDKCLKLHDKKEDAEDCESKHITLENCTIEGVYDYLQPKLSFTPINHRIPRKVRVRFSENIGDSATYVLQDYGMKGL